MFFGTGSFGVMDTLFEQWGPPQTPVGDKVTAEVIQRYIQYQRRAEQLELDL